MKRAARILALACVSLVLLMNTAGAQTIYDAYIGGIKLDTWDSSYDVIGDEDVFGISRVEISTNETGYIFDIYTSFASSVGKEEAMDIKLGDLFISINGWSPWDSYGTEPYYRQDTATNGEKWEYALVLDDHSGETDSGLWYLYSLYNENYVYNYDNIILSDEAMGTYNNNTNPYRRNQEVQYDAANQSSLGTGTWLLADNYLRFIISYDLFGDYLQLADGAAAYGFHWTMTCANDVIEGSFAPVPEPATMFLLGSGLLGLGAIRRKKRTA